MQKKSAHYDKLHTKFLHRHKNVQKKFWDNHKDALEHLINNTKQLAIGSVGAVMLLSSPHAPQLPAHTASSVKETSIGDIELDDRLFFLADLRQYIPQEVRPFSEQEEASVSALLSRSFGISVKPDIDGKRLDRSYGYIGAEQHLARYPGDTMASHFSSQEDANQFWSSGMAPGLGAWRYFAASQNEMTEKDVLREKYYIAVQTFLSKDFSTRFSEYRDFYKYRKMLLINPNTGRAIVVVVGDSGPAVWTGKHLGGSPEVMRYLERVDGRGKGPVIYMFIDDPDDTVPLGPIEPIENKTNTQ